MNATTPAPHGGDCPGAARRAVKFYPPGASARIYPTAGCFTLDVCLAGSFRIVFRDQARFLAGWRVVMTHALSAAVAVNPINALTHRKWPHSGHSRLAHIAVDAFFGDDWRHPENLRNNTNRAGIIRPFSAQTSFFTIFAMARMRSGARSRSSLHQPHKQQIGEHHILRALVEEIAALRVACSSAIVYGQWVACCCRAFGSKPR